MGKETRMGARGKVRLNRWKRSSEVERWKRKLGAAGKLDKRTQIQMYTLWGADKGSRG